MSARVYLPCTLRLLREYVIAGGIGPAPFPAHAVTDALKAAYADGDEEEWEYAAMAAAAEDSLALLGDDDRPRRVVVVAEVGTVIAADEPGHPTLVEVVDVVPTRLVVAVHVDAADAEDDVAAAAAAWERADAGDEEAQAVVERCMRHELGWYATQEISDLLED